MLLTRNLDWCLCHTAPDEEMKETEIVDQKWAPKGESSKTASVQNVTDLIMQVIHVYIGFFVL